MLAGYPLKLNWVDTAGSINPEHLVNYLETIYFDLSVTRPYSLTWNINLGDTTLAPTEEFYRLFQNAKNWYELTKGAVNPGLMAFSWSQGLYNADTTGRAGEIRSFKGTPLSDFAKAELKLRKGKEAGLSGGKESGAVSALENYYISLPAGLLLDFEALLPAFLVDLAAEYFATADIDNYFIQVGSVCRAAGIRENKKPWKVSAFPETHPTDTAFQFVLNEEALFNFPPVEYFINGDKRNSFRWVHPMGHSPMHFEGEGCMVISGDAVSAVALSWYLFLLGPEGFSEPIREFPEAKLMFWKKSPAGEISYFRFPPRF